METMFWFINANWFWLGPLMLIGLLAALVWVVSDLWSDAENDLKEMW